MARAKSSARDETTARSKTKKDERDESERSRGKKHGRDTRAKRHRAGRKTEKETSTFVSRLEVSLDPIDRRETRSTAMKIRCGTNEADSN